MNNPLYRNRVDKNQPAGASPRFRPIEPDASAFRLIPKFCNVLVLLCAAIIGLSGPSTARTEPPEKKEQPIELEVQSWKELQNKIDSYKGKVVVLDIWTTTCLKCIKEFPEFVALQKKHGREKVVCISVNCDYDGIESKPPEHYRERVLKFLRKNNARMENVMLDVPFLAFLNKIDLASTPAILVYDKSGELARRFDNDEVTSEEDEFQMADVERLIDRLLER